MSARHRETGELWSQTSTLEIAAVPFRTRLFEAANIARAIIDSVMFWAERYRKEREVLIQMRRDAMAVTSSKWLFFVNITTVLLAIVLALCANQLADIANAFLCTSSGN
jgi:hypothetical protein